MRSPSPTTIATPRRTKGRMSATRRPSARMICTACQTPLNEPPGFEDIGVAELGWTQASGEVGYAGDSEHLDAHVAGDDRLRHGRHADERCAEVAISANLCRGFKAGTADGKVNSLFQRHPLGFGRLVSDGAEPPGIGFAHIEESKTRIAAIEAEARLIRADQWIPAHHVDVVGDHYDLPHPVVFGDAPCGVGQDDGVHTERSHDAHGKRDLLERVSFVEMHAPLHCNDLRAAEDACDHAS